MLGFRFSENFNFPYVARSITEFWRRWHISLSSWFRDYVYIPLDGNRVKPRRHILNLLVVWMLTGLWHGASWNFVLWGLYYGVLRIAEKYVFGKRIERMRPALGHLYTMFFVAIGWVLFQNTDFRQMFRMLGNLFGIGTAGFADGAFLYYLRNYCVLLLLGGLCATPGVRKRAFIMMCDRPIASLILTIAVFLATSAYLVYGSYNPFLYFRF